MQLARVSIEQINARTQDVKLDLLTVSAALALALRSCCFLLFLTHAEVGAQLTDNFLLRAVLLESLAGTQTGVRPRLPRWV